MEIKAQGGPTDVSAVQHVLDAEGTDRDAVSEELTPKRSRTVTVVVAHDGLGRVSDDPTVVEVLGEDVEVTAAAYGSPHIERGIEAGDLEEALATERHVAPGADGSRPQWEPVTPVVPREPVWGGPAVEREPSLEPTLGRLRQRGWDHAARHHVNGRIVKSGAHPSDPARVCRAVVVDEGNDLASCLPDAAIAGDVQSQAGLVHMTHPQRQRTIRAGRSHGVVDDDDLVATVVELHE